VAWDAAAVAEASATIRVVHEGPQAEIAVVGDVDIATCPPLDDAVARLARTGVRQLTLDLHAVTFLGSSGLASLLRAQRVVAAGGGRVVLRSPSQFVGDLLEMTRLADRFSVEDAPAV
jgi:anti-sigma B factor antagonist